MAGVDDREGLDRLPGMCSKEPVREPTISRIRTWLVAGMEQLWSQLTPRKQADEIAAIAVDTMRSRRELVLENAVLRHQVNVLRRRSKRPKRQYQRYFNGSRPPPRTWPTRAGASCHNR